MMKALGLGESIQYNDESLIYHVKCLKTIKRRCKNVEAILFKIISDHFFLSCLLTALKYLFFCFWEHAIEIQHQCVNSKPFTGH